MKTAIIGLGRMGARHAQVIKRLGLDLSAICDVNPEARLRVGSEFNVPEHRRFADARMLVEEVRPDLLVVATTAPAHCEAVVHAASLGTAAVLCEKPMATSIADCDAMIAACRASGTKLAVNHQMRFMQQYIEPRRLVNSEKLGGLGSVIVSAGNFGAAMNGTHYFEMFRYMTGESPSSVAAWFSPDPLPNPRGPDFKDASGAIRLVTAAGKRFFLDCSSDQGHGMFVTYNCRYGRVTVDELAGKVTVVARNSEDRAAPTTAYGMPFSVEHAEITPADAVEPTLAVMKALLAGSGYPTGEDGRLAMTVLVAAHVSDENEGITLKLDDQRIRVDRVLPVA